MKRLLSHDMTPSVIAIAAITGGYVWVAQRGIPAPGGLLGHSLGIAGFLLMLGAETLYTLRKRWSFFRGRMTLWLQTHIFMGMVGSYLALLHTAGKFHGLAGVLAGVTLAIVISGFVGRFIYTAVPRTLDGAEVSAADLLNQCYEAEEQLGTLGFSLTDELLDAPPVHGGALLVMGRWFFKWRYRRRVRGMMSKLPLRLRVSTAKIRRLLEARYALQIEVESLIAMRRMLAVWHVFHVPLGIVLFTLAAVHIASALYYSTWSR